MGRVVVVNFVSIDGVIQSPLSPDEDREGGFAHGGWVPPLSDDTVDAFMRGATVSAAGFLLGRRSSEILRDAWAAADDAEPAVAALNRLPKYVVTSARSVLGWPGARSVGSDLQGAVAELRASTDGDLLVLGGAALVRGLAERDLVDEYRLLLFPVVLGTGKRMFDDRSHLATFTLTDSVTTSSGVVILTWTRAPRA